VEEKEDGGGLMALSVRKEVVEMEVLTMGWGGLEGVWTGMGVELLYFSNDDDERYSIQANEYCMRNSAVQAAAPPFGYAAYQSGVLTVGR
jgi:hypothetical protein